MNLAGAIALVFDFTILAWGMVDTVLQVGSSSEQIAEGVDDGGSAVSIAFLVAASTAKRLP